MDEPGRTDLLVSLAEIAVALLGFAAIVSVFNGRNAGWRPEGRFWGMVTLGFSNFLLALLPIPFLAAAASPSITWGICSASLSVVAVCNAVLAVRVYGIDRDSGVPYNPFFQASYLVVLGCSATFGVANTGFLFPAHFWPYVAALVLLQIATASTFLRLLFVWLTPR